MLIDKVKTEPAFYPILASGENESPDSILNKWDKFNALPKNLQDKISSKEIAERIRVISGQFGLNLKQASLISICVRDYFFGEKKSDEFADFFSKEMGVDLNTAQNISALTIQKIINESSLEKQNISRIEKLSLPEGIRKYPDLGEQLITTSHIKLKNFPDPVRPSIKNWISDYTFNAGHDSHNAMERGVYLFQNENTKKLNSFDRQRLAYILKAYDENSLIEINTTLKQVIFPKTETQETSPASPANLSQKTYPPLSQAPERESREDFQGSNLVGQNSFAYKSQATSSFSGAKNNLSADSPSENNFSFSSPHKLPVEKQSQQQTSQYKIQPQPMKITPRGFGREAKDDALPKNVVNLKE